MGRKMDYSLLELIPKENQDFVVLDCCDIHNADILLPLTAAWRNAVDHQIQHGGILKGSVAVIFMFNGDYGHNHIIGVLKEIETPTYYWWRFLDNTPFTGLRGEQQGDGVWSYKGDDGADKTLFHALINTLNTILYIWDMDENAIELIERPHDRRKIYKVRINLAYLRGKPPPKQAKISSPFRHELEIRRLLQNNKQIGILAGYVYALINPIFEGWVKIGSCVDLGERLAQYQTSDPLRRYAYAFSIFVDDRNEIEDLAHNHPELAPARAGDSEWFNVTPTKAQTIIQSLAKIS